MINYIQKPLFKPEIVKCSFCLSEKHVKFLQIRENNRNKTIFYYCKKQECLNRKNIFLYWYFCENKSWFESLDRATNRYSQKFLLHIRNSLYRRFGRKIKW